MDVDSSENRSISMSAKPDAQSNGSNDISQKKLDTEDTKETNDSSCVGLTNKANETIIENVDEKSPTNSATSVSLHLADFSIREANSSAIINNQSIDISGAEITSEIKQESLTLLDEQSPSHAISKIEVGAVFHFN